MLDNTVMINIEYHYISKAAKCKTEFENTIFLNFASKYPSECWLPYLNQGSGIYQVLVQSVQEIPILIVLKKNICSLFRETYSGRDRGSSTLIDSMIQQSFPWHKNEPYLAIGEINQERNNIDDISKCVK